MKKNIDIVTGTSIGAINGVFIVQNDLRHALKPVSYTHLTLPTIYSV